MRGFVDLTDAWATRLQRAIVQAYDRVIETALENEVDFVVVAGDMFDTSGASYSDYLHFFEGLHQLDAAGIPTYLTTGNHDPFSVWKNDVELLPPSCHMIGTEGPEFALFEREGEPVCLIGARGYRNQAWPIDEPIAKGIDRAHAIEALGPAFPQATQAPFCIGVIHTGLDLDQSKAYSNPTDLLDVDVDYWACGHLHQHYALPSATRPRIVFPGCIQARDLKESGERGCYLVTLERDGETADAADVADAASTASAAAVDYGRLRATIEFVPTASVVFHTVEVDVSACQTLADVAHLVQARLFHENGKASCDEMVERVVLCGTTNLHDYLRRPEVVGDLRKRINNSYPSFYCDALVDRTRPMRDREALAREDLFEAQVIYVSDEQRASDAQMINYVQAEFVKRGIDVPSSLARRISGFEDEAETLVLDLLGEERP